MSHASSQLWSAGDVKEPTHLSQRVGHGVPGVVAWSCSEIALRASAKSCPHSLQTA